MAKAKAPASGILVAKTTGFIVHDGERYAIRAGVTRIRTSHPLVKKYGHLFEAVEMDLPPEVEQATAAPGEKRGDDAEKAEGD